MYQLRILDAAADDLRKLDRATAKRVLARLQWLAEHFDVINREPLTGEFVGLYKFRIGDYRAIYGTIDDEQLIVVHLVGHRRSVYRRR